MIGFSRVQTTLTIELSLDMRSLTLLVLVSLVGSALAQGFNVQQTVESFSRIPPLARNVTTMHLSELGSTDEFTTLVHPRFPYHQVRVKKTDFCDLTVKFVTSPPRPKSSLLTLTR